MNNNQLVEITQIKIKLSDTKTIELTAEEARKLHSELSNLFKNDYPLLDHPYPYEQPLQILPYWEYPPDPTFPSDPYNPYRITCEQRTISINLWHE